MPRMTPSEAFVETMVANEVSTMFGIMGSAFMDAMDIFAPAGINMIPVVHEQGAGHMADGYSRASGKHGVVIGLHYLVPDSELGRRNNICNYIFHLDLVRFPELNFPGMQDTVHQAAFSLKLDSGCNILLGAIDKDGFRINYDQLIADREFSC